MPRLIIDKENFYELDIFSEETQFRYRIITDNKNYASYWSPIYSLKTNMDFVRGTKETPGYLGSEKHSEYINASWDSASIYVEDSLVGQLPYYDVWVQFSGVDGINPGEWTYKERVNSSSYNIVVPAQYQYGSPPSSAVPDQANIEIYRPGRPALRYKKFSYSITQNSSSVSTSLDLITLSSPHELNTGDSVIYSSSTPAEPLENDKLYFIYKISDTSFTMHENQNDALSNINKINLSSTGSGLAYFDHYPFLLYKGTSVSTPGLLIVDGGII